MGASGFGRDYFASGAEYTLTAQKDAAAQDLIYQPQPVNAANAGAVTVEMKHAYSKLSFLATAGSGYTGAPTLLRCRLPVESMRPARSIW